MKRLRYLPPTALAALLLHPAGPSFATDRFDYGAGAALPAVSGRNGKIAAGGGGFDDNGFGFVEGSFSLPVSQSIGFQADGLGGGSSEGGIAGGGAHLFWRDPSTGLAGVYGGVTWADASVQDYTHFAVGFEGQAYLDRVSIESVLGYEGGDDVEKGFFAIGDLAYYPIDDLKLYAGVRYIQKDVLGAGGIEYQLQSSSSFGSGLALFGEGRVHDDERWQAWGGIRFYFGENKSLIRRHREDDPGNINKEFLFDVDSGTGGVPINTGNSGGNTAPPAESEPEPPPAEQPR